MHTIISRIMTTISFGIFYFTILSTIQLPD